MSLFDAMMKDIKLVDMLNGKGKMVLGSLATLTVEYKTNKNSEKLSNEIFKMLDGKPWLEGVMALLFCFDMMLQDNPSTKTEDEITAMINELEAKMREGKNNEKDKEN